MVFQVRLARTAERDIETHYEWLKQRNPPQADRWFRGLMDKLATLQDKPRRCAIAVEQRHVSIAPQTPSTPTYRHPHPPGSGLIFDECKDES
jgi:plasmid stabilization system protein ParE